MIAIRISRFAVPLVMVAIAVLLLAPLAHAAETIPPEPKAYFNDYAGVVPRSVAQKLDERLRQFERETSNQILVAVFPKMQSDSSIEDYTFRVAEKWRVGQAKRDNGAVLFVFIADRAMFLQVGYGLEGALPDALAKNIIDTEIAPAFKRGDYAGGLTAGVESVIAATKGEYKGTGRVAGDRRRQGQGGFPWFLLVMLVILLLGGFSRSRRGYGHGRRGYGPIWIGGLGGGGRGGFGGFGGGGGFSGGGGGFGGGGAGGRW